MNVLENFLSSPLVYRAGWSLIHFVWQGLAIALVLAAALVLLRRRSAATRYLAAWAALLAMALCLPVTSWLAPSVQGVRDAETGKSTSLVGLPAETGSGSVGEDAEMTAPLAAQIDLKSDAVKVSSGAPLGASPANRADDAAPRLGERRGQVAANARPMDGVTEMVQLALPWMVGCWIVGVFALSLLHLGGWWRVRRLGRVGISPVATELDKRIRHLARRMGVDRAFRLLESTLVEVPTVFGWLRPVILAPVGILGEMSPQQLEMILAHELAHIRRHDYLLNLLQTALETLLFYHPAVWLVSHRIRIERENCCDDFVVEATGERLIYARALTRLVELRQQAIGLLSTDLTLAADGCSILPRIRRILGLPGHDYGQRHSWLGSSVAAGLAIGVLVGCLVFASDDHSASRLSAIASGGETARERAADTLTPQPVAFRGVFRAENLCTGETAEKPAHISLHLAAGDVIDIQFEDRSRRWAYVFTGDEPRPLEFSTQGIDKGRELLLRGPQRDEVVGLMSLNKDIGPAEFEQLCRRYSGVRSLDVTITSRNREFADLKALVHMPELAALRLTYATHVSDLGPLARLPRLALLDIESCDRLTTLEPLGELRNLRVLRAIGCTELRDVRVLERLTGLQRLSLYGCPYWDGNLTPLTNLESLQRLEIGKCGLQEEIEPLAGLHRLTHLAIHEARNLTSLAPLARLKNLREIMVNSNQTPLSLTPLSDMRKLRRLSVLGPVTEMGSLSSCNRLAELRLGVVNKLEPLPGDKKLVHLAVRAGPHVTDLKPLAGIKSLKYLSLGAGPSVYAGPKVTDLEPLADLANLEGLSLERFDLVQDLTPLSGLEKLTFLKLWHCQGISDLSPLSSLTNLEHLLLTDVPLVSEPVGSPGLKPLENLRRLQRLELDLSPPLSDLSPLAGHPKLSHLTVHGSSGSQSLTQLGEMPALERLYFWPQPPLSGEKLAAFEKSNPQCRINPRW